MRCGRIRRWPRYSSGFVTDLRMRCETGVAASTTVLHALSVRRQESWRAAPGGDLPGWRVVIIEW